MTKKKKKPAPNIQKIAKAGGFLLVLLALLFGFSPVSRLWGLAYVAYFPLGISSFAFLVLALFAEGIALIRFDKSTGRIPARVWVGVALLSFALSLTLTFALSKETLSLASFSDFFARYNGAGNSFAGFFLETGVYGGVLGFVLAGFVAQYAGPGWLIALFAVLFLIAFLVLFFPAILAFIRGLRSRRAILRSKRKRIEEEERAQRESLEREINDYGSPDAQNGESAPMPHEIPVPVFHYERPEEEEFDPEAPYAPEPPRPTRETRRFVRASNAFYSPQAKGQGSENAGKATPSSSAPGLPKDLPTPMPGPFSDAPVRHVGLQPAYLVGPGGAGLDTGPGLKPLFPTAPEEEPEPESEAPSPETKAPSPENKVPSHAEEAPVSYAPDLEQALLTPAPGLPVEPPTVEPVASSETETEAFAPTPEPVPEPVPSPIPDKPEPVAQPAPAPAPEPKPVPSKAPIAQPVPETPVPSPKEEEPVAFEPLPEYVLPGLDVIDPPSAENEKTLADMEADSQRVIADIDRFFEEFDIKAKVVNHTIGPSITTYEVRPDPGVPVSTIRNAQVDLDMALEGIHSRFMERVPGTRNCALEIQNKIRRPVSFYETIVALKEAPLQIPFGIDIKGNLIQSSLRKFVHMLVCGMTGSGKSVFMHSVICSILMRQTPDQVRFLLIDPKRVEMRKYANIPHLLCPIVTDAKEAVEALKRLVDEMEHRYDVFYEACVRDIESYNSSYAPSRNLPPMPFIVTVVDEYADLVTVAKDASVSIARLAAKARSAGIHLIIATQRPSVEVIDGTIKSNFSTRVALHVKKAADSMTILGKGGAEALLGYGDMLVDCGEVSTYDMIRCQGCYLKDEEIDRICADAASKRKQSFNGRFLSLEPVKEEVPERKEMSAAEARQAAKAESDDSIYEQIKIGVMSRDYVSINYVQKTFGIGFGRAQEMFRRLRQDGILSSDPVTNSAKGSKVLKRLTSESTEEESENGDVLRIGDIEGPAEY